MQMERNDGRRAPGMEPESLVSAVGYIAINKDDVGIFPL